MRLLRDPQVVLTALCGALLGLGFFWPHSAIPYLSVLAGSYFALTTAWESLRAREVDVNLLMVLAAVGAVAVGQPLDAAALLFLFSLSSTLEALAMGRTKRAIEALVKLRPDEAIRIGAAGDERVPVEQLAIGDLVRIPPFESIPVDGLVTAGESSVDQSSMTGESVPVAKASGDRLLAGTRNLDGGLTMHVESVVGDSTLDKIVRLVEQAQDHKASGERISAWFGQRYTFFVLAAFAASFGVRLALKIAPGAAFYESLTLLVALSPCALVISTPASTLSALAFAARNGILVRGGEFIERAGQIDTIMLDKTGTVTSGRPKLVEVCLCSTVPTHAHHTPGECVEEDACWHGSGSLSSEATAILSAAAALEQYASHPIAEAVVAAARSNDVDVPEVHNLRVDPGRGLSGTVHGERVLIGQAKYFKDQNVDLPSAFAEHVEALERSGMPMAVIAVGSRFAALGFEDQIRSEAAGFLSQVGDLGVSTVTMLTGDTVATAERIASQAGVASFEAALMPGDKARFVQEAAAAGKKVMMVGDGVNDAPALTSASVGVAMGGLGSDVALNSADVVLMHDRLDRIPLLMRLGRQTNRVIKANLFFAAGVIVTLTVFSLLGKLPLPVAVVGHEGSTVLVILNGLRLLRGPG